MLYKLLSRADSLHVQAEGLLSRLKHADRSEYATINQILFGIESNVDTVEQELKALRYKGRLATFRFTCTTCAFVHIICKDCYRITFGMASYDDVVNKKKGQNRLVRTISENDLAATFRSVQPEGGDADCSHDANPSAAVRVRDNGVEAVRRTAG